MLGAMALVVATGYLLAWIMRVPGPSGQFVQAVSRERGFCRSSIIYSLPDARSRRPLGAGRSHHCGGSMMVVFNFVFRLVLVLASIRSAFGGRILVHAARRT